MRPIDQPYGLCSIDPMTALTSAAFGLIPGLFGGGKEEPAAAPAAPPPMAPAQKSPAQKAMPKTQQPTFLGGAAAPTPTQSGSKTLLGQ